MNLQTWSAILGALISTALFTVLFVAMGGFAMVFVFIAIVLAVALVAYIAAAATAATSFGEFMRGWLLGLNAALNIVCTLTIVTSIAGIGAGLVAAALIGLVNLCHRARVAERRLPRPDRLPELAAPMSWVLIVAVGRCCALVSSLAACGTRRWPPEDHGLRRGLSTGTMFIKGGGANLAFSKPRSTWAISRHRNSGAWHKDHEAGHTLNLAAFGALFHLIGAVDENVLRRVPTPTRRDSPKATPPAVDRRFRCGLETGNWDEASAVAGQTDARSGPLPPPCWSAPGITSPHWRVRRSRVHPQPLGKLRSAAFFISCTMCSCVGMFGEWMS
jgi:hypothetical protein